MQSLQAQLAGSAHRLLRIDTGYACFGLVCNEVRVIDAPPIARWTIGRSIESVCRYYSRKNAKGS